MKTVVVVLMLLLASSSYAASLYPEKTYQDKWCADNNGVVEYVLDDHTRVDCLTDLYAIEFDFAHKWAESIGQSLYYAIKTARNPGIVIILEKSTDTRYLKRLQAVSDKYGIKVWTMSPDDL